MFPYFFWAWLPTHVQNIPKSSPYIPNMKLNTSKSIKTGNVFETGNSISIRHCLAKHSLLNQRWHSTTLKWVLEVPVNSLVNSQGLSMIELVSVEGSLFVQFVRNSNFFREEASLFEVARGGMGGIPNAQEAQLICMELARRMEDRHSWHLVLWQKNLI